MSTAASASSWSEMTAEFINPIIVSTRSVFEAMLECTPKRCGLNLKDGTRPGHELSAVIGVTGMAVGTIVVSLSRQAAFEVLRRLVGIETENITADVCDAVGELGNMIAGSAKARLHKLQLSIGLPNVVCGTDHHVHYPSSMMPISIAFESEVGPFAIEFGFRKPDTVA